MPAKGNESVIRLRSNGTPGRFGVEAAPVETVIQQCHVIPRSSTEDDNTVIVGLTLVAPGGTDLLATDRVRWEGKTYEIEGQPGDYRKRGRSRAVIAALRRVTG